MSDAREIDRIADELRRAWDGDPWHGDPVRALLDGLSAADAAARPIPGAHTAWEIVLHLATWTREVTRRLATGVAHDPEDPDWPAVPAPATEEAWHAAVDELARAHEELVDAVLRLAADRLDAPLGDVRDRAAGTGVSHAVLLHGAAQHLAYHGGQIALLRRALGR